MSGIRVIQMSLFMRLLWPLLLIAAGTALVVYAVGLSERCCASINRLRSRNPGSAPPSGEMSRALSTRMMTAIFRLVGMYVILAAAIGLFGIFISR
jgi:hypothetical protein